MRARRPLIARTAARRAARSSQGCSRILRFVDTAVLDVNAYAESVGDEQIARPRQIAAKLRDLRILHLNATPYGGGVAGLLNSIVPLECGLALGVSWGVIVAEIHLEEADTSPYKNRYPQPAAPPHGGGAS